MKNIGDKERLGKDVYQNNINLKTTNVEEEGDNLFKYYQSIAELQLVWKDKNHEGETNTL